MKRTSLFRFILPAAILLAALLIAFPVFSAGNGQPVRVWVEFKPGMRAEVENAARAAGAEMHYVFENLNAIVISVPEQALAGLQRNPNVVMIEEDAKRELFGGSVPYGIDLVQARDVWDADRDGVVDAGAPTGGGVKVCVIDSGLYTGHEDFIGLTASGYNTGWNNDTCGHGTHVAGTIAAKFNDVGVVGVAPGDISLYIVKVFDGPACGWTYSSTLADAANKCATAGAKIISMSLGGGRSIFEQRTFDSLYSQGILSIAAAGNAGTTAVSYPGGYSSVVSVAAVDSAMQWASFSQYNSTVELAAPGVGVLSTVPFASTNKVTVDGVAYNGQHVEYSAFTDTSGVNGALVDGGLCTTTGAWSGKVVLCQRGDISFYDKVMNVQNSGGIAALIYNNVPGDLLATLGEGNSSTIPAIGMTQMDGQFLVANKLGASANVVTTAPTPGSGYEAWDGTSMATPHVSGVAALVWSFNPSLTNVQIRSALTATAKDLGTAGRDNYYGYGLVQAYDALVSLGYSGGGGGTTPALTVAITANSSYKTGQTANITVKVTDQTGASVSGAAISASVKNPAGTPTLYSGTTDGNGNFTFSYPVEGGKGTYTITATATKDGYTSGTATKTFTVKR